MGLDEGFREGSKLGLVVGPNVGVTVEGVNDGAYEDLVG